MCRLEFNLRHTYSQQAPPVTNKETDINVGVMHNSLPLTMFLLTVAILYSVLTHTSTQFV